MESENKKVNKYAGLSTELKRLWKLEKILPIVISAEGVVSKRFLNNINTIGTSRAISKHCYITKSKIVRKFLNAE